MAAERPSKYIPTVLPPKKEIKFIMEKREAGKKCQTKARTHAYHWTAVRKGRSDHVRSYIIFSRKNLSWKFNMISVSLFEVP